MTRTVLSTNSPQSACTVAQYASAFTVGNDLPTNRQTLFCFSMYSTCSIPQRKNICISHTFEQVWGCFQFGTRRKSILAIARAGITVFTPSPGSPLSNPAILHLVLYACLSPRAVL